MTKRYRLLKEILNYANGDVIPVGEIFEQNGSGQYVSKSKWVMYEKAISNPDWFQLLPERIEVAAFSHHWPVIGNDYNRYSFKTNKEIDHDKFPAIKKAIEFVLNDDSVQDQSKDKNKQ